MKKRRWKKKFVSILLVLCMLGGYVPTQTRQVQAFDLLSMFDIAGTMTRAGKNAMSQAKKQNWSPLKAIPGTFKEIGKELLGLNNDDSPGSTVVVNKVDLSGVEKEMSQIQEKLNDQGKTLQQLEKTMNDNMKSMSNQLSDIKADIKDTAAQGRYYTYLNGYFEFYNDFLEAVVYYDKALSTLYDSNPSQENIKSTYDQFYKLDNVKYTGNYYSAINNLGKYLRGEYQTVDTPGSVVDILCEYYRLAGYSEADTAKAVKEFVANTYYTYSLANYYYMSVALYQNTYITDHNLSDYSVSSDIKLNTTQIENHFKEIMNGSIKTTNRIFGDLNKHFCSAEDINVGYEGPAGSLTRAIKTSKMDIEAGSKVTMPDSKALLKSYFGDDYSKMFDGICDYSYESSDNKVTVEGYKLSFNKDLAEGDTITVDMYCTVEDEKIKLHTYEFTCKEGKMAGGYGTSEYPYSIKTVKQFDEFAKDKDCISAYISLDEDLDFKDTEFHSIGEEFRGVFYGNGHKISNVTYSEGNSNVGIFRKVSGNRAIVQDLTVEKADMQTGATNADSQTCNVGVIAGQVINNARIERCEVIDSIASVGLNNGTGNVGGITGSMTAGKLDGCIVRDVRVYLGSGSTAGGLGSLVGKMSERSSITHSGREGGKVWLDTNSTWYTYAGGLVGIVFSSTLKDCWSFKLSGDPMDDFTDPSGRYGSIVGLCSSLWSGEGKNYLYNGEKASITNTGYVTYAKIEQGEKPVVEEKDDFTCNKLGFEYVGMLTNDTESIGNPIRLAPLKMKLDTSEVKKNYYYGEELSLTGLGVYLNRSEGTNSNLSTYQVTTDYNKDKAGTYKVTISNGDVKASYDVTVAKKPHVYKEVIKQATCTVDGGVYYQCEDEDCDEAIKDKIDTPALGHDMKHMEKVEPTCLGEGRKEYWHCNRCNLDFLDAKGEQKVTDKKILTINALGHDMKHIEKIEPTCLSEGVKEYWHCNRCNLDFLDAKGEQKVTDEKALIIKTLGHDMEHMEKVEPTCLGLGVKEYWHCNRCNLDFLDAKGEQKVTDKKVLDIKALGHDMEHMEKVEPTCLSEGRKEYWHCDRCNLDFLDAKGEQKVTDKKILTINALGHNMEHKEGIGATCILEGRKEYWHCSSCGYDYMDEKGSKKVIDEKELVIPKNSDNHISIAMDDGDCTTPVLCMACGKIAIPAKSEHTSKQTITKATLNKDGEIATICSVCNKKLSTTTIPRIADVNLSIITFAYNKKVVTPTVTLKDRTGKVIDRSNYTVSYAKGRKDVGSYNVTITLKGNYSGTISKTFTIQPKTTSISKLKAGKKKLTVKWKKQTVQTTGYEIAYSTSKQFKNAKIAVIKKNKTTSKRLKKLKKKKYYVRIRTYKTVRVNGKSTKLYSTWSKAKNKKVK